MHEYPANGNSYTYTTPKVKRVTVTESVYDENGNIVKETVTETEYFDYSYQPFQPYVTYTSSTPSSITYTTSSAKLPDNPK